MVRLGKETSETTGRSTNAFSGAFGASPLGSRTRWWATLGNGGICLLLGGTIAAACWIAAVATPIDLGLGVSMLVLATSAFSLGVWLTVRAKPRWPTVVPILLGIAAGGSVMGECGMKRAQGYFVNRCLEGSHEGCREAFIHGLRDHDERSVLAAALACKSSILSACYGLWEVDAEKACAIEAESCDSRVGSARGRDSACRFVAEQCTARGPED